MILSIKSTLAVPINGYNQRVCSYDAFWFRICTASSSSVRIRYNKLRKLKKGKKIDTACRSLVE